MSYFIKFKPIDKVWSELEVVKDGEVVNVVRAIVFSSEEVKRIKNARNKHSNTKNES